MRGAPFFFAQANESSYKNLTMLLSAIPYTGGISNTITQGRPYRDCPFYNGFLMIYSTANPLIFPLLAAFPREREALSYLRDSKSDVQGSIRPGH